MDEIRCAGVNSIFASLAAIAEKANDAMANPNQIAQEDECDQDEQEHHDVVECRQQIGCGQLFVEFSRFGEFNGDGKGKSGCC